MLVTVEPAPQQPINDSEIVRRVREAVLTKGDLHLASLVPDRDRWKLFADPRINPFADVFILIAIGCNNRVAASLGPPQSLTHLSLPLHTTRSYQRFLSLVEEEPGFSRAEILAARQQIAEDMLYDGQVMQDFLNAAAAAHCGLEGDTFDRAVKLYCDRPSSVRAKLLPLSAFQGLTRDELEAFVLRFVDAAQLDAALRAVMSTYKIAEARDALPHAYEYFLKGRLNGLGSYNLREWPSFIDAYTYAKKEITVGRLISKEFLFELNAILLWGDIGKSAEALRESMAHFTRPAAVLNRLFDEHGRFITSLPVNVPFEGFYVKPVTDATSDTWTYPQKRLTQICLPSTRKATKALRCLPDDLRAVVPKNFRDLPLEPFDNRPVSIVMSADDKELKSHLDICCAYFNKRALEIASSTIAGRLSPGSAEYVRKVADLAAAVARPIEASHFPVNGNGRTGMLTEWCAGYILGLDIPGGLDGRITIEVRGKDATVISVNYPSEHGTWMTEKDRADLIFDAVMRRGISPGECLAACRRLLPVAGIL